MDLVWVVVIVIAAGFLGGRIVFAKERLPAFVRDIFLSGWEFILIGVMLGPIGFDMISKDGLSQLNPFLSVGLAWAGLIFGVQMRLEDLLKVDRGLFKLTVVQAGACWVGLYSIFTIIALMIFTVPIYEIFTAACIVAAAGSLSSPTALALMAPRYAKDRSPLIRKLLLISNLDLAPALVSVGLVFCFFPAPLGGKFYFWGGIALLSYSVMIGFAMAGLFRYFGREALSAEEDLAVIIGFLAFISGVAFYLGLSPLFLSLIVGIALANTLKSDDPLFGVLFASEKPFYVILLILTGLWWGGLGVQAVGAALAVFIFRLWLKMSVTDAASKLYLAHDPIPKKAGLALSAQGALALAIGINYLIVYPGPTPKFVFGVIVLSTVASEIAAPFLIQRVLGATKKNLP